MCVDCITKRDYDITRMNYGFWSRLKKPFTVLAPMAEVTDAPFRGIVVACGKPDALYTEFVSAAGLCSEKGRPRLLKDLAYAEAERPIVAQFFGADPSQFYEAARIARKLGFDGVDVNMGCPDRKVVRQGAGIGLCKTPALAREIIQAAKEGAGDLPVSVKTRLGADRIDIHGWIASLIEADIPALIVHLRTMREISKIPAHWECAREIGTLAHARGTLFIANGDVMGMQEVHARAAETGADGVMVGRGIFHNPWFFDATKDPATATPQERVALLLQHTRAFTAFWGRARNFAVLKRFYKIYASGWDGAKELRAALMEVHSAEETETIVRNYLMI